MKIKKYILKWFILGIRCFLGKNFRMVGLGWFLFIFYRREVLLFYSVICFVRVKGLLSNIFRGGGYVYNLKNIKNVK